MPEEDPQLRRRRARQHVDERKPFDELRFADPLSALLEFGLHHADNRRSAVCRQADLEEAGHDLAHLLPLEVHGRATPGGASLLVYRDRRGDILERGSRAVEDRDLVLAGTAWAPTGHDLRELGVDLLPPEEVCGQRVM